MIRLMSTIAIALCVVLGVGISHASAAILPAQTVVSHSTNMAGLDVAMSEDGTGGAVYTDVVDGKKHVFAVLLRDGAWSAPIRVDGDQKFDAFSPRIGAANGGRLVVTWVERGPLAGGIFHDQLYSASLDPGVTAFESPVLIDFDVGPEAFVTQDVSLNAVGIGYIVYRVVKDQLVDGPTPSNLVTTRLARYNGWLWSRLDQEVNRNTSRLVRFPKESNAPKVVTDQFGNAVVAFQEPGDAEESLYSRIWLRRVFGSVLGLPLLVSPTTWNDQALRGDADAITLDGGTLGNAVVGFRQAAGNPPALDRSRVMLNSLPNKFNPLAGTLDGVQLVDTADVGSGEAPRAPSVAVTSGKKMETLFSQDSDVRRVDETGIGSIGTEPPGTETDLGINLGDDGNAQIARAVGEPGAEAVSVIEETTSGGMNSAVLAAEGGKNIEQLEFDGNRSGDAAIVFRQSDDSGSSLVAAAIDSAPDEFEATEPDSWVRDRKPQLKWEPSTDYFGAMHYEIRVDGKLDGVTSATSYPFSKAVRDGRHNVLLSAVDRLGQSYTVEPISFRIDRKKPRVRIKRVGSKRIVVTLSDGKKRTSAGISRRSKINWGDRRSSRVRSAVSHRFSKRGRFVVTVKAFDKAGNRVTVRRSFKL
jgi:hypothetical protein